MLAFAGFMSCSRSVSWMLAACALAAGSCTPAEAPPKPAPPPAASQKPRPPEPEQLTEEPEPNAPELRTGRIQPIEHTELLQLKVSRHALDGDEQLLELALPEFAA